MNEELILKELEALELERVELNKTLLDLTKQENELDQKIQQLIDQDDMGMEVFSPRSSTNSLKQQIAQVKKHIDELQYNQMDAQNKLEQNALRTEKYQYLLLQVREKVTLPTSDDLPREELIDELKEARERTLRCLDLLHADRVKCKNELANLNYYLNAMIAKYHDNKE